MDLSKSLRLAIANENIKHNVLAKLIGTTGAQISRWLRDGNIKAADIEKISTALKLKPSEFVALGE